MAREPGAQAKNKSVQKGLSEEDVQASMHTVARRIRLGNYPQCPKPTEEMYDILDPSRFSSWTKLLYTVAFILRFIHLTLKPSTNVSSNMRKISKREFFS